MIGINTSMKHFYPTYLYVKTHNITGLKYFGKTTKANPESYLGSGEYWLKHLKIHGKDISTEIVGFFENKEECVAAAMKFSEVNNIVGALTEDGKKIWANQVMENGLDGGYTGRTNYEPHTEETKQKISASKQGQLPWNTGRKGSGPGNKSPRSNSTKRLLSEANTGKKRDPAAIQKTADKLRGRKRPDISERLTGLKKSQETKEKMKAAQQNKGPLSAQTKEKIQAARATQQNVFPIGEFLKGKVIVVDKFGNNASISNEVYYSQTGPKEEWEWVSHKSKEAKMRRG